MGYERTDKRKLDEFRDTEAKVGIIARADGSAMFRIGKTIAYAAVYGPRNMYPKFMQDPQRGTLRCNYNMMPFSASERVKPGGSRRSKEISHVTEKALMSVVNLDEFPNAVVDVFIELPQCDSGTRCAGICAASMALADAGIPMSDLVSAIAVGKVGDKLVVDLTKEEEDYPDGATDMAMGYVPTQDKFVLMQMDGEINPEELKSLLKLSREACLKLDKIQRKALNAKYESQKVMPDDE